MTVRSALLAALLGTALLPATALAGSAAAPDLVLTDPSGDANGVNDQGSEHLVGDVTLPVASAPEADLVRVRLAPLRERRRITGWSVAFRAAAPIGPHGPSREQLQHGLVAQPTPDCRFVVTFTTGGPGGGSAQYGDSGGCGAGRPVTVPLRSSVEGEVVRVELPYRLLPPAVQAGALLPNVSAWVRLAPEGGAAVGELDNVLRGRHAYRLPAAG